MNEERSARDGKLRRIARNFGFLAGSKVAGDVFTFVLFVALSRVFGQEGIGRYSFALAYTGFFAIFADFGLHGFSIREVSRLDGSIGREYGHQFHSLRLVLSGVAILLLLASLPLLPVGAETRIVVVLLGAYQLLYRLSDGLTAVFIAKELTRIAGLLEFLLKAFSAILGLAVILAGGTLVMAVATLPVTAALQLAAAHWAVRRWYGKPEVAFIWEDLWNTARRAVPHAASQFLFQVYSRVDVVFLGLLIGEAAAGVYNVAHRVVFVLLFIPHYAAVALFPQASNLFEASMGDLETMFHQSLRFAVLIGLPMSAGLWLIAPEVIQLIYGEEFAEAGGILGLLSWLLILAFVNRLTLTMLVSCNEEVSVARRQWIAAGMNVAGNLLLIPVLGMMGAALVTLASELLLLFLFLARLRPIFGFPRIGSRVAIGCIGIASFCIPFKLLEISSVAVIVPLSVVLYLLTLFTFREIRENEWRTIRSLVAS